MYCKNCQNAMNDNDNVCSNCGTIRGEGKNFCANCGAKVEESFNACPNCGFNLHTVNENNNFNNQAQPNFNQNNYNAPNNTQQFNQQTPPPQAGFKSRMAAGLLGIFLGSLGIHNFYLGFTGKAVGQLLISVLTCGFGSVISGIWGLVEGIMILSKSINYDANGNALID